MPKLNIVEDKDGEPFSTSPCDCHFCLSMHLSNAEWKTFTPKTNLQRRMMAVVDKWENKK